MQSGVLANRLIGLLLAVTMLCPSWLCGNCCCSRRVIARNLAACCQSKVDSAAETKPQKACCAKRALVVKSAASERPDCHPVSPCRCRTSVEAVAVTGSVRSSELTSQIVPMAIPGWIAAMLGNDLPSNVASLPRNDPGDPPSPLERCAQLCRWLA